MSFIMTFIYTEQHKKVKNYLENDYKETECMERNKKLEKYLILKSKIELKLLANINAGIFDEWQGNVQRCATPMLSADTTQHTSQEHKSYLHYDNMIVFLEMKDYFIHITA
jgi:hypothetical protein